MKITFYHTLYKKEVTWICDDITFKEDKIIFVANGKRYSVEIEHIKKIEAIYPAIHEIN